MGALLEDGVELSRHYSDNALVQFTAGHCGTGTWSTDFACGSGCSHVIGPVSARGFSSAGDGELLYLNNPSGWNPQPWAYTTSFGGQYAINNTGTSSVGMPMCTAGGSYGSTSCGKVTQLNVTATYDGVTVQHLGRASFCGTGGDSGAAFLATVVSARANAHECRSF